MMSKNNGRRNSEDSNDAENDDLRRQIYVKSIYDRMANVRWDVATDHIQYQSKETNNQA